MIRLSLEERKEEIDRKCRMAGCSAEIAKKHMKLFAYETWDCHPEDGFLEWLPSFEHALNPITAWNCQRTRQAFYKWKGSGQPVQKFSDRRPSQEEFRALYEKISQIGQRV